MTARQMDQTTSHVPDGDHDQEVPVVVDGREITHVMVVSYRDGKPVAIRNPWSNDPAMPCSREFADQLLGMVRVRRAVS